MRKARTRHPWLRTASAAALGTALLAGCPSSPERPPEGTPDTPIPPLGGEISLKPSTTGGSYLRPLDAVPSGDGSSFYFTAQGDAGLGVFRVASAGASAQQLAAGAPLVAPFGLGISTDDKTLFVADVTAGLDPSQEEGGAVGQIFALPVAGGAPSPLGGTAGTRPRALSVVSQNGADVIYYSGVLNDKPGLLKIGAGGGSPAAVATGAPFVDPSGVAVTRGGDAYVVNTASDTATTASIVKVSGGSASEFLAGLQVGYPAGIALSRDEATLLISGQDGAQSVIFMVNLATKAVTSQSKGLEGSLDSGGLHRARNADIFSWCGVTAGLAGTVFRVEFK